MRVLLTGGAGFIGMHVTRALVEMGHQVVIIDNLNDYYDPQLKYDRLKLLGLGVTEDGFGQISSKYPQLSFYKGDIADKPLIMSLFERLKPEIVINLAAQAGVRYSLVNPDAYVQSNVVGFLNILEAARHNPVKHLVYASSSSVYGLNAKLPYSTHDSVSHPVSLYAATKIADEMMAHSYAHLFNIPCTGLRFFTVYGPWGRPDMSPFLFADAISKDKPLKVYNYGKMRRDFTYIDDIVAGIIKITMNPPHRNKTWDAKQADWATSSAPFAVYNIGNTHSVNLIDYISAFERAFGKTAIKEFLPLQPGDVLETYSDMSDMKRDFDFVPQVDVEEGVRRYVSWFKDYYKIGFIRADKARRKSNSQPRNSVRWNVNKRPYARP